ncbi:hypothetical protein GOBAR_AA08396 [Gossypium barbadense]|uniref:Uncharacterized protein n=1 Tax=Gossypium barbadense TaxID=3634 RepID=A0A2P5Y9G7_GOSBA|nr:hypothetical protein GOBAR_AA08396 [Gossypium barbadense]
MVVTRLLKAQQIGHDDIAFISEGHKKDDSVGLDSGGLHQFLQAQDEVTRLLQDDGNSIGTSRTVMI